MDLLPAVVRALQRRPLLADALLALLVLAVELQPLLPQGGCGCPDVPAWGWLLVTATCVPLVGRRRAPFTVALLVGLLTAVHGVTTLPEPGVPYAGLVGFYAVAAHASRRLSLLAVVIALVAASVSLALADADAQDVTVTYLVFATAWLLGDGARSRRDLAAQAQARAEALEQGRVAEAERVVAAERTRIARELHDVVAHHVSLMVVQAEAGPVVVERAPARAVAAFDAISATGKQALLEMRQLLGVLRTEGAERTPQPGVAALDDLARTVGEAGLPVEVRVSGHVRPLPTAVELSAYRVVQEALTNTLRHARPAEGGLRAVVHVRYADDALAVEVREEGALLPRPAGPAGGGLVGMRERAALVGGQVRAGPGEEGGWTVRAVLPLQPAVP